VCMLLRCSGLCSVELLCGPDSRSSVVAAVHHPDLPAAVCSTHSLTGSTAFVPVLEKRCCAAPDVYATTTAMPGAIYTPWGWEVSLRFQPGTSTDAQTLDRDCLFVSTQ
jgi:hypothetical protein